MTFSLPRPEHKVELTRGRLPADQVYPTNDRYQFQEFPLVVIELGGYQDATIINPYSGERLWISDACAGDDGLSTAAILRRLADALDEYNATAEPASQQ